MKMHKKLNVLRYFKRHTSQDKYFNRYFDSITKDFKSVKDIFTGGRDETVDLEDIYVPLKLKEIYREPGSITGKERVIDPLTALENHRLLAILGVPGAGKTTLLKHLVL